MAQLILLLGGRAADEVIYGEPTTRAEDDLRDAADLARRMVAKWAMTEQYDLAGHASDRIAGPGVRRMIQRAETAARQILRDHEGPLRRVTLELVRRETLTIEEIDRLVHDDAAAVRTLPRPGDDPRASSA